MALSKRGKTALAATAIAVVVAAAVVVVVVLITKNKNKNQKWSNLANDLIAPWKKLRPRFIPDPYWGAVPNASTKCGATQSGATKRIPKISAYNGACTGGTTSGPGTACEYTTLKDAQDGCDADGASACSGVIGEHIQSGTTGPVVNHFGLVDATSGYACVTGGTKNIQHSVLYQRTV